MKTIYKKLLFLLLILPFSVFAQSTLSGTVVDKTSQQPLPGVNVVVQGSTAGTQTDFDGKFQLGNLKKGDVVVFSYLGYKNYSATYNAATTLNVSLEEDSNQLQEVVVQVGYGSVKKKDATGAVELITAKDFNRGAITSVDGLLNGRASGVVVTGSGTPGDNPVIRIRGGSSLLASNDPLVVVDGLPLEGVTLSSINPNDIESFSILKDASSAAIYGNRGSNGVILITTKKGSKKGIQVNFSTFTTMNTLAKKQDVYGADAFRQLITERVPAEADQLGTSNTDWQKEIFKNSYTSDVNASVLGNIFEVVPARLTIGNTDNNGILLTSEFKRTTASFALNPSLLKDHLKFNVTGNYSYTYSRKADEGAIGSAITFDPTQSVYDPSSVFNGYYESYDMSAANRITLRGPSNPVSQLLDKRDIRNLKRFYGNFNLDYKLHFLPEVRVVLNYGYEENNGDGLVYTNPFSRSGFNGTPQTVGDNTYLNSQIGNYSRGFDENFKRTNENRSGQLNYNKAFGKLNVDVVAGYEWQQFTEVKNGTGNLNAYGLDLGAEAVEDTYTSPGNNLQAYFGRANLGFDDKYLVTVNFRRDGSSKISPINKWANFWGGAFAWKIKEESFLKNSNVFSDLKLRLSYGETGQQNIPGAYLWFKKYLTSNTAYYQLGDTFVLVSKPDGYNENLKWERSKKYNVGIDFGFFNNRLRGTVDGYFSETTDLFANAAQGALTNLYIYGPTNVGSLETKGAELGLNVDAVKNDNFNLNFNYNVSYTNIKLTGLATNNLPQGSLGDGLYSQTHQIGLSPFAYWVFEQVYDTNGRPIEGAYVDRDGNGTITSNDKYNAGKPQADVTMGLLTNANYKNWDFSMGWRASIGNDVYDKVSADRSTLNGLWSSFSSTIQNTTTDYSNTNFTAAVKESDYYVKDASFIKLDNVTVGYNFKDILRAKDKTNLRLYAGVQNVLIITKYKGIDPEVFNNGVDGTIFPRARMFMLGLNANF